ncbi:KRAB-A domain-containing protein 2-like [Aphis craccivora]|uniref:KRAB-A domain-containing protein 2-like n=1 Tax=Aphis craccivora TaxID=307492 RepID=A0A6G0YUE6_APHCR|nr:KRAB-A domain-containing protein 2-like [Aphis craccivora]
MCLHPRRTFVKLSDMKLQKKKYQDLNLNSVEPTDSANIIYVITEHKKKGLHKLGTAYGLLKDGLLYSLR